nr:DUF2023 family protein [uncultured Dethiosulfovibrio sp.]
MEIFCHHVYEYWKGLRNLILHTAPISDLPAIVHKLDHYGIPYLVHQIGEERVNVFFGHLDCISVVQRFGTIDLSRLSDEQDFILGIMLGYDRMKQCSRYLKKRHDRDELIG